MVQLKDAVEQRKAFIIQRLINNGYYKHESGPQLYEMPLKDLERTYIDMMTKKAKKVPVLQVF